MEGVGSNPSKGIMSKWKTRGLTKPKGLRRKKMTNGKIRVKVKFEYEYDLNEKDYPKGITVQEMIEIDTHGFLAEIVGPDIVGFEIVNEQEQ